MNSKITRNLVVAMLIVVTSSSIVPHVAAVEETITLEVGYYAWMEVDLSSGDSVEFEYKVLTIGADIDIIIYDSENFAYFQAGQLAYYEEFVDDDVAGSFTYEAEESDDYYIVLLNDAIFTTKVIYYKYTIYQDNSYLIIGVIAAVVVVLVLLIVTLKKKKTPLKKTVQSQIPHVPVSPNMSQTPTISELPMTPPPTNFCGNCGKLITDGRNFCTNCGEKM